jgi:hypothetical protein
MNNMRIGRPGRGLSFLARRMTIRRKITAAIVLALLIVVPAVALPLVYFSDILGETKILVERDVRFESAAAEITSCMLGIRRLEYGYRVFGNTFDRNRVLDIIAHADSILEGLKTDAPVTELGMILDLSRDLDSYSASFRELELHIVPIPPDVKLKRIASLSGQDYGIFESTYRALNNELELTPPALRDSVLAESSNAADLLFLERIVTIGFYSLTDPKMPALLHDLDASREEIIASATRFSEMNRHNMEIHRELNLQTETRAKRNIMFVLILDIIVLAFMTIVLPRRIVKPIAGLSALIRQMKFRDNTEQYVFQNDEVGELALACTEMAERMHHFDDLKTKKILTQKRFIDRLLDYLDVPACILTKNYTVIYMNSLFSKTFGSALRQKIPEGGLDLTLIPEMQGFLEAIGKKLAKVSGDFTFTVTVPGDGETEFRCRPVRNTTLNLETILVIGVPEHHEKG